MTNPAAAIKMLVTYAICIPVAMLVGYVLTDPLDYGTLGFLGLVIALIFSPIFIKWHYPIMVFGLGCPMYMFFLVGDPPMSQVVVILCLGIAIVERTLNADRRFISVPSMTWPLMFTVAMALITAELTGGIGLHTMGGSVGGGKKYITLFVGVATYFALTSRPIPKESRKLYIGLFFLSALPSFISDLFPLLPNPLNYINLLFPPTADAMTGEFSMGLSRLGAFAATAGAVANYMLARYGLRGIFMSNRPLRIPFFIVMLVLTLLGGFRIIIASYMCIVFMLFFVEGLHRTRLLLVFIMGLTLTGALLVPLSNKLPYTFQRALSFLPLNWDATPKQDAEGSKLWRERIWDATWPKVPDYLLLGKGYALRAEDFEMMGDQNNGGQFVNGATSHMDASEEGLAISSDFHDGKLSTLIPFGIWGAISILWLMAAGQRVLYRNWKYGDLELKTMNAYLLVANTYHILSFFFVYGAYHNDVGQFGMLAGLSIALNWGVRGPARATVPAVTFKSSPEPQPA
jgi:hypothetical protein